MQATIAKSADYDEIAWQLQALCSIATMRVMISRIFAGATHHVIHPVDCFRSIRCRYQ